MQIKKSLLAATVATLCTVMTSESVLASDWLMRARVINISPNDNSQVVDLGDPFGDLGVAVDNDTTLELDFTYMLSKHLGLELILATTEHVATGTNDLSGASVGSVNVLPPTLTLQYHFSPGAKIRPYVGAGLNYTVFYGAKVGSAASEALEINKLSYDNSFGLAAQAGVDISINKDWFFNLDVKYIQIDTKATIHGGDFDGATIDVDINPWVFGIGIGTYL